MKVAAGIYNCGYHFFWTEVMKELEMESDVSFQVYLLRKDKVKLKKYAREHDHANMAKRKANEHAKLRKEVEARRKNISKNMEYSPMVGCDTAAGVENKSKVDPNICRHALYGCKGGEKSPHKIESSESCTFYGTSQKEIREIRNSYFVAHPEAKEEYDKMVATTCTGVAGVRNKSKVGRNICRHKLYGCIGGGDKTTHKTERSKSCTFNGKSAEYIRKVRDAYFIDHPNAKVEYDKMYPEVVTVGNGKKKKKIEENMGGGNTGM